jgi:hypothetical protein
MSHLLMTSHISDRVLAPWIVSSSFNAPGWPDCVNGVGVLVGPHQVLTCERGTGDRLIP